jgi:DNA-directed RNA polymerase specialized sigma24 family protein
VLADVRALLPPDLADDANPEHALVSVRHARDLGQRIGETLAGLNPRYRRAIELRLVEERSREACAEALEVKLGTFDVLLLRALRAFRTSWEAREQRYGAGGNA